MEEIRFKFFIKDIMNTTNMSHNEKTAAVETKAFAGKNEIYHGTIRVRFNDFGIFPDPADIAGAFEQNSMRKLLSFQLRKYIKPQKPYL